MPHNIEHFPVTNKLLSTLPWAEYERLRPHLTPMHLRVGKIIYEQGDVADYIYFPTQGMLSLLGLTVDGSIVEVAMIGSEGVTGLPAILRTPRMPWRVTVQLRADVLRLSAPALRAELARGGQLQDLLLRFAHTTLTQVTQSAVCHRFHTTEQRLCRWLLTAGDRARSDTFRLTQESIAQMLGVPRTSVTMIASRLQRLGLIQYHRGQITILNRRHMSQAACECYGVIADEINHYLAA
jgi:CRP-like cAMP-binding protein